MVENAHQTQASSSSHSSQVDHVAECIKAVDDYRGQQISKWNTVVQITVAISSAIAGMNSMQHAATGGTYLVMLDEHDQVLTNAHVHGRQGPHRNDDDNGEHREDTAREDESQCLLS